MRASDTKLQLESFIPPGNTWLRGMIEESLSHPPYPVAKLGDEYFVGTVISTVRLRSIPSMKDSYFGKMLDFYHLKGSLKDCGFKINDRFEGALESAISDMKVFDSSGLNLKPGIDDILDISGDKRWYMTIHKNNSLQSKGSREVIALIFIRCKKSTDNSITPNSIRINLVS